MKLCELPSENIMMKLVSTKFKKPALNVSVWRYYEFSKPEYELIRNEYSKANENDGADEYMKNLLKETDTSKSPPELKLNMDDFSECCYPEDKSLWFSGVEINGVCNMFK